MLITTLPHRVLEPSSSRAENFGNTMIRGDCCQRCENIFCHCFLQAMPRQCATSKACAVAVCDEAFSCAGCAPPIPCPIPRSKVTGVLSRFLCKRLYVLRNCSKSLFVVTRVPERIHFNGRNNCSLWEARRNAKKTPNCIVATNEVWAQTFLFEQTLLENVWEAWVNLGIGSALQCKVAFPKSLL